MDKGVIQGMLAAGNFEKTDGLLVGFIAQPLDLAQFLAAAERPVFLAVFDHRLGYPAADPGHVAEQRRAGRVDIHPHVVDGALDDRIQALGQLFLVDIVLVQAHAHRFGINLDQLGQRVLQAAGDGNGPAHAHVQVGELGPGQVAGGVDRSAGFVDHHIGDWRLRSVPLGFGFSDDFGGQAFGFAAGRAVADGNHVGPLLDELEQDVFSLGPFFLRFVGIDGDAGQKFAGWVHQGYLAAGTKAGVNADDRFAANGRLKEKLAQIGGKGANGVLVGGVGQFAAQFVFDGGGQQPFVAIGDSLAQVVGENGTGIADHAALDALHQLLVWPI